MPAPTMAMSCSFAAAVYEELRISGVLWRGSADRKICKAARVLDIATSRLDAGSPEGRLTVSGVPW